EQRCTVIDGAGALDGANATVVVECADLGPAILALSPSDHDFGSIAVNTNTSTTFTVENVGEGTSGTVSFSVTGTNAPAFSVTDHDCDAPLPGGASCTATVRFAPGTTGAKSASLSASATPGGDDAADLAGTAVTQA